MNYTEAVDYLYSQLPMFQRIGASAYRKDLTNTLRLCEHFGQPQRRFRSIHIAGTNGKGSTSHALASVLQEQGYKVGLYTSPHLRSFTERIKINGQEVAEDFVTRFVAQNKDFFATFDPSFFEITVAMAFVYFAEEKVDMAVIETGMGGRLDSTNVITPLLSVITNIGWDHTQFLGDTLEKIAGEKAGIIKPGVPVVVGERQAETDAVFVAAAAAHKAPLVFAEDQWELENHQYIREDHLYLRMHLVEAKNGELFTLDTDLNGLYQLHNMTTVMAALSALRKTGIDISEEAIHRGLQHIRQNTGLMGRWQVLQEEPLVIADVGHNLPGLKLVLEQLQAYTYTRLRMVIGFVKDKDIRSMLDLLPREAVYYFTRADLPRALDAHELKAQAAELGLEGEAYDTVYAAKAAALADSSPGDLVFIGGSSFVVAEAI